MVHVHYQHDKTKGLPVDMPLENFIARAPWMLLVKALPFKVLRDLSGNSQCLPLFGSIMVLALFSVELTEGHI